MPETDAYRAELAAKIATLFEGQSILITGGTGSFGKKILARILGGEHGSCKKVYFGYRSYCFRRVKGRSAAT